MQRLLAAVVALVLLAGCSSDGLSKDALEGNTYVSTEVTGHDLVPETTITVSFEDGRMSVQAGCNTQGGGYEIDGDTLRWTGDVASTLIGCPDELADQDQWLNGLLTDGVDASLDGETLTLTSDDVEIVLEAG